MQRAIDMVLPCEVCEELESPKPACALIAGHWYCLAHLRDLAQRALTERDEARSHARSD